MTFSLKTFRFYELFILVLLVLRFISDSLSLSSNVPSILNIILIIGTFMAIIFRILPSQHVSPNSEYSISLKGILISTLSIFWIFLGIQNSSAKNLAILFQLKLLMALLFLFYFKRLSSHNRMFFYKVVSMIVTASALLTFFERLLSIRVVSKQVALSFDSRYAGLFLWPNTACFIYCLFAVSLLRRHQLSSTPTLQLAILLSGAFSTGVLTPIFAFVFVILFSRQNVVRFFAGLLVAFPIIYFLSRDTFSFFLHRVSQTSSVFESIDPGESSFGWRLVHWQKVVQLIWENDLFGVGLGATESLELLNFYQPHNDYLRIVLELGLLGTFVLVLFLLSILKNSVGKFTFSAALPISLYVAISAVSSNVLGQTISMISILVVYYCPGKQT